MITAVAKKQLWVCMFDMIFYGNMRGDSVTDYLDCGDQTTLQQNWSAVVVGRAVVQMAVPNEIC